MSIKSGIISLFAKLINKRLGRHFQQAISCQEHIFDHLIQVGKHTSFGKDHQFLEINNYSDYKKRVPIRDYELLKPYIDRVLNGESDVLWKGKPVYFAKTSGTTSGAKFIPITKESIPNHFGTARNAVFQYIVHENNPHFLDGKMIFLSGSPALEQHGEYKVGRLSGISNHLIPAWLRTNQLPNYEVNCISDWEEKVSAIVDETYNEDIRLIGGIPPWVQMYFEALLAKTGKASISEIFPNLSIYVHGGVNYAPYRSSIDQLIGKKIATIETFPASEGFIAYQDRQDQEGLILNVNSGILFEFIPVNDLNRSIDSRVMLDEVQIGVNYAILITSNAGLWSYNIGDTIEFIDVNPFRIRVTGRIKHYISAFGEHVIAKEVEEAMSKAIETFNLQINEFTVAPLISKDSSQLSCHEWYIEWQKKPTCSVTDIESCIERSMMDQNSYYKDLVDGAILGPLRIISVREGGMRSYMSSIGKLGGQNKMVRLSNDRKIATFLSDHQWIESTS